MTASKLTCPECSTVLKPAKPVPPGKKVKCPRCETIFTAGALDDRSPPRDEEDTPAPKAAARKASPDKGRKPPAKAPPAKAPPAKAAPKKKDDDEEGGVYGYIKEEGEEEEEEKPQISYAPDMSIKDLRGPAVAILMPPTNKLTLCGMIGFLGWLALLVLLLIPAMFPIQEDTTKPKPVKKIDQALAAVNPQSKPGGGGGVPMGLGGGVGGDQPREKKKAEEDKSSFFEIATIDLSLVCELPWYVFLPSMLPIVILMCYSGLVAYGAIQMQNLESYGWGMAASIMVMIPGTCCGGVVLVTGMVIQFALGMIMDDTFFIGTIASIVTSAVWLACVGVGIWSLTTLFNPDVVAGFEYEPE
jgi:hypothetical protein